jgi:hypothetical protein
MGDLRLKIDERGFIRNEGCIIVDQKSDECNRSSKPPSGEGEGPGRMKDEDNAV